MKLSRRGLNLLHRTFCHPAASFKHVLNRISFPADDQKQLVDKRIYTRMYKYCTTILIAPLLLHLTIKRIHARVN